MIVLIGSKNKIKIEAAKEALKNYFDDFKIIGVDAKSNVNDNPVDKDVYNGAKNRLKNLKIYADKNKIDVDLYMSVEAGMINLYDNSIFIHIVFIEDKFNNLSFATSSSFPIPINLNDKVSKFGLSKILNSTFNLTDSDHFEGSVNYLTKNILTRKDIIKDAFIMALTKYINGENWKN